jgi:ATP-dependent RNA/DNA helicase IGHMBP2
MPLLHVEPLPHRATKAEVLDFLDRAGGLDRRRVGRIELRGSAAVIEVPEGWEARLLKSLDGQVFGDRRVRARIAADPAGATGPEDHFGRLLRLLDLESREEARRAAEQLRRLSPSDAEKTGSSLIDLAVADENAGLGGRYIVQLVRQSSRHAPSAVRPDLPWTRLDVGSPVMLSPFVGWTSGSVKSSRDGPGCPSHRRSELSYRGVVCQRSETAISVALDGLPDELGDYDSWRLDAAFDEVATQRQRAALEQARMLRGDRGAVLRDVLVAARRPEFGVDPAVAALDRSLNESQIEAVQFALSARDVGLIHGPPGTGKTTTVVEVIRQAVRRGRKVLACAPSNLAVDNVLQKLLQFNERAVRVGHPARVLPELREHTLDLLVEEHPDVKLARKLVKQAMALFREAGKQRRAAPKPGERRQLRDDARSLLADARKMEQQAVESILASAAVVCATTTGIDSQLLGPRRFDLVVIDEACQSTEPGCWIPLLRGDRLVLAGDHCQLPPTVISQEAAAEGFGTSLFERLIDQYGPDIARRLTVQYRMNQSIMEFSSRELYDGQLQAHETVREHRLCDLPGVAASPLTERPVELIDTAGANYDEGLERDGESRMNRQEAELVAGKVRALLAAGVAASDIAVISPYGAQVRLLRETLAVPSLEIDSVDGFQGREKEAVMISLVRSNAKGEIGFLADIRRMNVAMTRARRKLLIIGDSATLGGHPFYSRLIEYCEAIGVYGTVWEM